MDFPTNTPYASLSPETAPPVGTCARKSPGLILNIPVEMLRAIASNLDSDDLFSLSLTCRKAAREVQAVLYQRPSINILEHHSRLRLLVRSSCSPGSNVAHLIQELRIEYDPMDDLIYLPEVPRVAMIPRLGDVFALARHNIREDVLLHQLLCVSSNLRVLHLQVFGDILPVTPVPGGFQKLRGLFLRRLSHGYGETVSNSVDNSRNTSMKDLVWLFKLPRLTEVTLDNFGRLQDVGSVSAAFPGQFTPKSLALVETSIADDPSCTIRAAIDSFLRAFKSLECMEWHLSRLHPRKALTIAWVVDSLQRHKDTLKTLVLSENKVMMAPFDMQDIHHLPPEVFLDTSFISFTRLEHLCVMDLGLYSKICFDPRSNDYCRAFSILHKLPSSLKQLVVVPLGRLGPAIGVASIVRTWNEITHFLPAIEPRNIYFVAIPFYSLELSDITIVSRVKFADEDVVSRDFGTVSSTFRTSPHEIFLNSQAIMERFCVWQMRKWHQLAQVGKEKEGRRHLEALARYQ